MQILAPVVVSVRKLERLSFLLHRPTTGSYVAALLAGRGRCSRSRNFSKTTLLLLRKYALNAKPLFPCSYLQCEQVSLFKASTFFVSQLPFHAIFDSNAEQIRLLASTINLTLCSVRAEAAINNNDGRKMSLRNASSRWEYLGGKRVLVPGQ